MPAAKAVIIIIIILVLLSSLGVGAYFLFKEDEDPSTNNNTSSANNNAATPTNNNAATPTNNNLPEFTRFDNHSATWGLGDVKTSNENVSYYGEFDTQDECEARCRDDSSCAAYSWIPPTSTHEIWRKQCYGRDNDRRVMKKIDGIMGGLKKGFEPAFDILPNISVLFGLNAAKGNNAQSRYFGGFPTVGECEIACANDPDCTAYSYIFPDSPHSQDIWGDCYGRKPGASEVSHAVTGVNSGVRL